MSRPSKSSTREPDALHALRYTGGLEAHADRDGSIDPPPPSPAWTGCVALLPAPVLVTLSEAPELIPSVTTTSFPIVKGLARA